MTRLNNVNTSDLLAAIQLGCRTMSNVFNADDNDIPFFGSEVLPNPRLSFSRVHSESHVPGRHLNALLTAEDIAGVVIDEQAVEKHAAAAFYSYSGPVPLPLNRDRSDGPLVNFNEHNLREGFHALYALARYRNSARAIETAEASIAYLLELWSPDSGWDRQRLESEFDINWISEHTFITGIARAIGPLVKYYRATHHAPALELASMLAAKATSEYFLPDGAYDREKFGTHTHSTTCVMSSLAQLADLTAESRLLERVKAFYDNGLWKIRDEIGWVIESSSDDSPPDLGECNNTGDIVETALVLGRRDYPEYFQDAERIVRGHLLPAQLRDNSFIADPPNSANEDGMRDVAARHLGAFGFPAPYGHQPLGVQRISFNMDIVGGAVASLCEVLREAVVTAEDGHRVNLMFDRETEAVSVAANPTGGPAGGVTVTVHRPAPLWVRLPSWADRAQIEITGPGNHRVLGDYVLIPEPPVEKPVEINYPIAESEISLSHRTQEIRARLLGDTVVTMDSFGADLTFFDPIDS